MTRRRVPAHASRERFEARVRRHADERFIARKLAARARQRSASEPLPAWAVVVLDELLRLRVVTLAELDALDLGELETVAAVAVDRAYATVEAPA